MGTRIIDDGKNGSQTLTLRLLQDNCPNLQTLDLSNVMTIGRDCVLINIERLQQGCTKMKTLRLTNSMVRLAQTSLSEQVCRIAFCLLNSFLKLVS